MENDKHLWPYMALVMPAHISEVIKFATTHSVIGGPISCDKLRLRMVEFLRSLDIGKKRHLCISAEDLVGLTQGCSGKETYAGSPALMATARDALYEVFGPDLPITFYLSTRNPDRWLRSSYWQNLRSLPLRMAYATFAETCPDAANFDPIIAQTREALGYTPLLPTAMEDRRFMRFGPSTPSIRLFALPPETLDALTMPISHNASPSAEIIAEVLALNRSGLNRDTLDTRKKALLG